MSVLEALGRGLGGLLAPIAAEASLIRGAAVLHADGVVVRAEVTPLSAPEPLGALGESLRGPALVRFSNALRRTRPGTPADPRDVLGAAVRFRAGTAAPQDLLLGTFQHLWQMPFAALLTRPYDFLANDYHTALPFHVRGTGGRFTFDLVPEAAGAAGADRFQRLRNALEAGHARLTLLARGTERGAATVPLAVIALERIAEDEVHFDPFEDGAGIVPAGFFNGLRAAVYPASQLGASLVRGKEVRR